MNPIQLIGCFANGICMNNVAKINTEEKRIKCGSVVSTILDKHLHKY